MSPAVLFCLGRYFALIQRVERASAMLTSLKKRLLTLAQAAVREVDCPHCKHHFQPFAGREIESFSELMKPCLCPKCGKEFALSATHSQEGDAGFDGPFEQPLESRIERRVVSERELLFHIPASGRWGPLFIFAVFWNLFSAIVFGGFVSAAFFRNGPFVPLLFAMVFVGIGLILAYFAIRGRFATHLIYVSPEIVRMQRSLFRPKTYTVPTDQLVHVEKAVFYTQNYKPVYGIEISAAKAGRIRFGTGLSEAEKNWLCWEIREFARSLGARV